MAKACFLQFIAFIFTTLPLIAAERPNVLLILTDDQGFGDVTSHGNDIVETPNLDRLASQGARFDRFYVSPVCAPTRASLLTGRYFLRTGVHGVTRGYETLRPEEITIAELLKDEGYATGCFGKWHNGRHMPQHPNGQGFNEFFGFCGGHWNTYFNCQLERNGEYESTEGFIADTLTDAAMSFMEENAEKSFFCYVPYNTPHWPPQVGDKYFDKYAGKGLDIKAQTAYALVDNMDENVGRLLSKLDELGVAENTLVIFLSDNGANSHRYNAGMKGYKGSVDEGGTRVPMFVRWPGKIKAGITIEPIAKHIDLLPTLAEICGADVPSDRPIDGKSLVPLMMEDGDNEWPDRKLYTFHHDLPRERGNVRTQRYLAVAGDVRKKPRHWALYDMQTDPEQKTNIASEHPEVVKELSTAFETKRKEVTAAGFDPIAAPVGHPDRMFVRLLGHEALLQPKQGDGISYFGKSGWSNDWVTNWTDADSYPLWPIDVLTPGKYAVTLKYICPEERLGSVMRCEVKGDSLTATFKEAHDPGGPIPLLSPDRFERPETKDHVWKDFNVGTIELSPGMQEFVLKAEKMVGGQMPDIKEVELRYVGE
ncbi:arylsulfatase [Calycomorphotria hydatis]|uniref:Arylsulfatase n=1 Tax=Calycomorphotria hydatis TaxID=2528027 RepID=A0A517TCR3_9PLAN|nr:arylsulfatase [Calycomorphotria hydatis]QDT66162.1 Arylsulfatase precursor [Calycomorphotria hydatis]